MMLEAAVRRNLNGFKLDVRLSADGGVLGLLGESGSGKSMTLRAIAGIDPPPDGGRIELNGRTLFDREQHVNLIPQKRRVSYLFQSYALFPNMTVAENIGCSTRRNERSARVAALIEQFGLHGLSGRYPSELSGGQQQRVALARCVANKPEALLLDEPFSALDEHLRQQIRQEFFHSLKAFDWPVVLVTHSREEAYQLCDRLVVLKDGHVVGEGDTRALFECPKSVDAARILGVGNLSPVSELGDGRVLAEHWGIELTFAGAAPKSMAQIGIRAHELVPSTSPNDINRFAVEVVDRIEYPRETQFLLKKRGESNACPLWCTVSGCAKEAPQYLCVDPMRVLLLTK